MKICKIIIVQDVLKRARLSELRNVHSITLCNYIKKTALKILSYYTKSVGIPQNYCLCTNIIILVIISDKT